MKNNTAWWFRIPVAFFLVIIIMEISVDGGDKPAFLAYPLIMFAFMALVLLLLIAIAFIVQAIENVLFHTLDDEAKARYLATKEEKWEWTWGKNIYNKMLGSKPMEEEVEIILDHNYDGIRELDNKLPPWWVYLFYASIVFAVVYLARFHIFNDYTQDEEYAQEVATAQLEIEEGGRDGKGMIAWKQNLKPAEIAQVASYVLSFQGTTAANPKAAEGDIWVDPNAAEQVTPEQETNTEQVIDSTSVTMN